jgi:hypothetical protein
LVRPTFRGMANDPDTRELFLESLLFSKAFSNLPEVYNVLGEENFIKLLFVFGGYTIRVPSLTEVRKLLLYCHIRSKELRGKSREEVLNTLNIQYSQYKKLEKFYDKLLSKSGHRLGLLDEDSNISSNNKTTEDEGQ